jgi:hypothetical protein
MNNEIGFLIFAYREKANGRPAITWIDLIESSSIVAITSGQGGVIRPSVFSPADVELAGSCAGCGHTGRQQIRAVVVH